MSVLELFYHVDNFCQALEPAWRREQLASGLCQRQRNRHLCLSQFMTIVISFHQSHYRNFRAYYPQEGLAHLRSEFPGLVSYSRFVEFMPSALLPLCAYLRYACLGTCTGIAVLDSTALAVRDNHRIKRHRVFAGLAQRDKTSMGWFFGFTLHLIFNDRGDLLTFALTPGNVDDRRPVPRLVRELFGKIFADKGYISQPLFQPSLVASG